MEATQTTPSIPPSGRFRDRWQMLGGERFYTFARWLIILLLCAISPLLTNQPLWPVSIESGPIILLIWSYIVFALASTILLLLPFLASALSFTYLLDIIFISLIAFFGGEKSVIFFPLYLLPLISGAIRQPPLIGLFSGAAAAVCYATAFLGWSRLIEPDTQLVLLDYVGLGLRSTILVLVPWLTSGLAERWSQSNRRSVAVAQEQSDQALRQAQSYRDQMRALYEVAYSLSTTMDYRRVMESTLRESRKLVPYTTGMVLLSTGKPDELYIASGESLQPVDMNRPISTAQGILGTALRSADSQMITDISRDPGLQSIASMQACKTACVVPLRASLRTYGLLLVGSDRPTPFTREQLDMLNALASYAIISLQNAQLIFDLKEERNKLISKEEEVRHQLARDLHDGPAQSLAAITMNLEFIKRLLERDPSRVVEELDKLSALSKRTTYEVRTMLFELRPLVLETQGLKVTLEQYLDRFRNNSAGTKIVIETEGIEDISLDTKTEGTLFNIIQESVNNALKHARAKHIWVRLKREEDLLRTVVQDDGAGFDLAAVMRSYEKRGSFGLLNIDERARLIGGNAEMESAPGQGTKVTIIVPLDS